MNNYWRRVASVLTGSSVAQLIPILGSLIIARQFAPSQFGEFSVWLGAVLVLAVLLPCRFEMSLAIESDGEPRRLAVISTLATACLVAFVVSGFLVLALAMAPELLDRYSVVLILSWLPAGLAVAATNTWLSWAAASGRYGTLSILRISQAVAITSFQILVGAFFPSAGSLAVTYMLGALAGVITAAYLLPLGGAGGINWYVTIKDFWWRQRQFPAFSLPAGLVNTTAAQLPVLIVATRFGADIAGLLAMTIKVLGAPSGLLGRSVLDVFKRHASTAFRERGECRAEYIGTLKVLAWGAVFFCLTFALTGEFLFATAFGEAWRGAGTIAIWLLPLFAFRFIASPLSYVIFITGKQHFDLMWQLGFLATTVFSLVFCSDYEAALLVYGCSGGFLYVIYIKISYKFSG
ncbi:MAG: hypothetical protein V7681_07200 [Halopseudomonas sabulinigri]